jgi:antitoxin (DNA-binding transcriptional repressor) of toxin-antitoxin stability system
MSDVRGRLGIAMQHERVEIGAVRPHNGPQLVVNANSRSGGVSRRSVLCITRDTLTGMAEVSIRDLRNHGGDVVERAMHGERITITRSGRAVAELRAISPPGLSAEALLSRRRRLPPVDPGPLRRDVDRLLDAGL